MSYDTLQKVKAEDPDEGQNGEITYSLDFGNKDGYFSINDKSGEITLKKIIPPMMDTILEFSLFIRARDGTSKFTISNHYDTAILLNLLKANSK